MPGILLVQPPIRDFYLTVKRTIPYGLACIAAALQKSGFSVDIFDGLAVSKSKVIDLPEEMQYLETLYNQTDTSPIGLFYDFRHFGYSFEHIGSMAKKSGAFLIGISSLFTPYADEALKTAEAIKRFHPNCKIVLGGHHPTTMPSEVMKCKTVDFVLRGEGEVSMPLLAEALKNDLPLEEIPGIVFRKKDRTLFVNSPATMKSLDDYPRPALELIKYKYYQRAGKGSAVITASRGCPMKCSYCSVGATSYLTYRRRSISNVLSEIEIAVKEYNAGFIDFEDENLSLNRKWFLELLAEIKSRFSHQKLELRAMNGLFPPSLDEEMIIAMKDAGFRTLNLSLCSISEQQLKQFKRPNAKKAFDIVLKLAEKHALEAVGYIIVGAPGQEASDSIKDFLYLAQRRVLAGVSVFYPAPGSCDYDICKEQNLLPENLSLYRSTALPLSHTTTRKESLTLLRLGRILNFMKHMEDQKESSQVDPKIETGAALIKDFLKEGTIWGISKDGEKYKQDVSPELTSRFINGLKNIEIRGCK